jgi:hypothetical protein
MPHLLAAASGGPGQLLPRAWVLLPDAEWAALLPFLPGGEAEAGRRGRKPENLRRTLDAIFWVAASTGPRKDLPPELGKPDSASRTLRRWARAGVLEPLLERATRRHRGSALLGGVAWWLARAFRRMARILSTASLRLVRDVLRLADAWPANPLVLPDRNLSETARQQLVALGEGLRLCARRVTRAARQGGPPERAAFEAGAKAARAAIRAVRKGLRLLRLGTLGNRHQWRLR